MTQEEVKRMCRKLTALNLHKHGYLSLEGLMREIKEETALDESLDDLEVSGLRKLRCGLCNKPVATISLTIRPFAACCLECMP